MKALLKVAANAQYFENQSKDLRRLGHASVAGTAGAMLTGLPAQLVGTIPATLKLRRLAEKKYGKNWKDKYTGGGSFTAKHPIVSNLLSPIATVSAYRGANHFGDHAEDLKRNKKKERDDI